MKTAIKRLLNEPLARFIAIGSLLGIVMNLPGLQDTQKRIVIDASLRDSLAEDYAEDYLHEPDAAAISQLVAEHIENEVLYREGLRHGLDEDDPVIRKRVIQKMRLIVEGENEPPAPDHATLDAWRLSHPQDYTTERQTTFLTLHFTRDRPGASAESRAQSALTALQTDGTRPVDADPFLAGNEFRARDDAGIARVFGDTFAGRLANLPVGQWSGPVQSPYGLHLVKVTARQPERLMSLEECESDVRHDWYRHTLNARMSSALRELIDDYVISSPETRTGARGDQRIASKEDAP